MNNENPYDAEFIDPGKNYEITMMELRDRIEKIRLDIIQINDAEVKGFAEKKYIELRIEYFKLMRDMVTLEQMFGQEEEEGVE